MSGAYQATPGVDKGHRHPDTTASRRMLAAVCVRDGNAGGRYAPTRVAMVAQVALANYAADARGLLCLSH